MAMIPRRTYDYSTDSYIYEDRPYQQEMDRMRQMQLAQDQALRDNMQLAQNQVMPPQGLGAAYAQPTSQPASQPAPKPSASDNHLLLLED